MYYASLAQEEGQPITFHIVFIDPTDPDPNPPSRILSDRWGFVRLGAREPFSLGNITKLAKASDPRTSSLAVYYDSREQLFIWGFIDQGNRYHEFIHYNTEAGPERPGVFQASVSGVGHLTVYREYERIGELKVATLSKKQIDVFGSGPIRRLL